jgi:16S rRNA (cytidine1402-2'-O)-methyltransferase
VNIEADRAPDSGAPDSGAPDSRAEGSLVLVGTPIGNLGDLSPRARQALADADMVCCEDTRRTRVLLSAAGLKGRRLLSLHGHNEAARVDEVLAVVEGGACVAVVSDAGMPGISDPGARLVAAAAARAVTVTVIPGPTAVVAALVASGLPTDRFCFEGFLPRRGELRRRRIEELSGEERTVVLFESPRRLAGARAHQGARGTVAGIALRGRCAFLGRRGPGRSRRRVGWGTARRGAQ